MASGLSAFIPQAAVAQSGAARSPLPGLQLLVSAGIEGRLFEPSCDAGQVWQPTAAATYLQALVALRQQAATQPASASDSTRAAVTDSLLFDAGDLLAPDGVMQAATQFAPEAVARWVAALDYQALALGAATLAQPRWQTQKLAEALARRGIPLIASNLHCKPSARALCQALTDAGDGISMLRAGRRRIALLSLLSPAVLPVLAPSEQRGLALYPLRPALRRLSRAARQRGAKLVVASVDFGPGVDPFDQALQLVEGLPPSARPDVLLLARGGQQLRFARPATMTPPIVAPQPGQVTLIEVHREAFFDFEVSLKVRTLRRKQMDAAALTALHRQLRRPLCDRFGHTVTRSGDDKFWRGETLLRTAVWAARQQARAEVALVPWSLVHAEQRTAPSTPLRALDLLQALHRDAHWVVADVDAAWLRSVQESNGSERWLSLGLTSASGALRVNGRPLIDGSRYRVLTTRTLAFGQAEPLPPGPEWREAHLASLRQQLLSAFQGAIPPLSDVLDRDPADAAEWNFRLDTDASFAGSNVSNPNDVEEAQLQRADALTFGLELSLRIDALARRWRFENLAQSLYRTTRTEDEGFAEGSDRSSLRNTAAWRAWRQRRPSALVPEPYVQSYAESELTKPASRDAHYLLLRPAAGLQFEPLPDFLLRFSSGIEWQTVAPSDNVAAGLGVQMELKPWSVIEGPGGRRLQVEANLDYFVSSLRSTRKQTLRARFDSSYALSEVFALALVLNLFGLHEAAAPLAVAIDGSAALRVRWSARRVWW
ncbi:MAG: hypothetical protein ACPGUV_09555 [Polyangiales bacterium]